MKTAYPGFIEDIELILILKHGRMVIAEGVYGPITIIHYKFKGSACYLIKAPISICRSLSDGGAWARFQKPDAIVPWFDITKANALIFDVFGEILVEYMAKNASLGNVGDFKLKEK